MKIRPLNSHLVYWSDGDINSMYSVIRVAYPNIRGPIQCPVIATNLISNGDEI